MKHDIHLEGYAFALRPVALDDASFIAEVRTPDRTQFMYPITRTVQAQEEYLKQYFQRQDEYYFVVQRRNDQNREGLAALFDFDVTKQSAQLGRLVLRPGSFASADTALLLLRLAFGMFKLAEVWGFTLTTNTPMIAYLRSCGFEQRGFMNVTIGNESHDAVDFVMTREKWRTVEEQLAQLAQRIAQTIQYR